MTAPKLAKRQKQRVAGRDGPDPIDKYVGARIRLQRTALGLSQEGLGLNVGLSFQQVQKYERGINRVSASTLWRFSQALKVPISFFFEQGDGSVPTYPDREVMHLMKAFGAISNVKLRRHVLGLVRHLANVPDDE